METANREAWQATADEHAVLEDLTGYSNKLKGENIFKITRSSRLAESEE